MAMMEKAMRCLDYADFNPPVVFEEETLSRLKNLFAEGKRKISAGVFTRDELYDCIIETEFSEWNPVFLYAVNSMREKVAECFDIGPRVQMHEKYIRQFIEKTPDFLRHLDRFMTLPVVWRDRILIVDDEPVLLKIMRDLFEMEWSVETATSGREALEKMRYGYFDVIISDINMRPMDGPTMYREAKNVWPDIGERFLFYSGKVEQFEDFFRENDLKFMMKPATMNQLKKAVRNIAKKNAD